MKKLIISLAALFAMCGGAAAQQVKVADVEALPGETVSLAIQLDTDGGSYTGLEFDIKFPQAGFITTGTAKTTAMWDGAFTIGDVGGVGIENLARCGVLSYNYTAIPGTGLQDLGTVAFAVGSSVALEAYTVTLCNMTLIGETRVPVPDATFTVNVVSNHSVVLDENSATAPEAAENVNVTLKRSINAGKWSTICLPFNATGEQVKTAFGNDVVLASFTGWKSEENNDGAIIAINVIFSETDANDGIAANTPMLIRLSDDVSSAIFEGVTLEPVDNPVIQVGQKASERGKFYGTYAVTKVPEEHVFIADNMFYYSTGATTIKGYRGYFEFKDVLDDYYNQNNDVKYNIVIDGITKAVNLIEGNSEEQNVYDLGGRKIAKPQQRGIYIVDGKKALIK